MIPFFGSAAILFLAVAAVVIAIGTDAGFFDGDDE